MSAAKKGDPVALCSFLDCWADSLHGLGSHALASAFPPGLVQYAAKLADAARESSAEIRRSSGLHSQVDAETAAALVEIFTRHQTFGAHLARIVSEWAILPADKIAQEPS